MKKILTLTVGVSLSIASIAQLEITEIHYNPSVSQGSDQQFIEIHNAGGSSVDMTGYSINQTSGNNFTLFSFLTGPSISLGAGEYLVIGPASFLNFNYYNGLSSNGTNFVPVTTTFGGFQNIDNGSTISLLDASSSVVDAVTFAASGTSNGGGKTWAKDSGTGTFSESHFAGGTPGGKNNEITCWTNDCNAEFSESSASTPINVITGNINVAEDVTANTLTIASGSSLTVKKNTSTGVGRHVKLNGIVTNNGTFTLEDNCTLEQVSTSPNVGSGTSIFGRDGSSSTTRYNLWGSPLTNASITSTFPSSNTNHCDIFTYASSTQEWKYDFTNGHTATCNGVSATFNSSVLINDPGSTADGTFDVARGYFAPGISTNTRSFSGSAFNNGTQTISTLINGTGASDDDDWNLLSNVYPSGISAETFMNANPHLRQAVYLWDPVSSGAGSESDYKVWTSFGSSGITGTFVGTLASLNIAAGQGFMVEAQSAGTTTFNNTMRNENSDDFRKTNDYADGKPRVWLSLSENEDFKSTILVGMSNDATEDIDNYDAHHLSSDKLSLYSLIDQDKFSIQAVPSLFDENKEVKIPLGFNTLKNGTYKIELSKSVNIGDELDLFILDKLNNKLSNLKNADYSFFAEENNQAKGVLDRFELIFKQNSTTSVSKVLSDNGENIIASINNNLLTVKSDSEISSIEIYDISGRQILSKEVTSNNNIMLPWEQNSGLYILKVKTYSNFVKSMKIISE